MSARRNRSNRNLQVDSSLDLTPAEIAAGANHYNDWHWGIEPGRVVDWKDPDMPRVLVECGRLARFHFRNPNSSKHTRRQRDTMVQLPGRATARSHVAFDPDHPFRRLYFLLPPSERAKLRRRFWAKNNMPAVPLAAAAAVAGGRHARGPYPAVRVKPFGVLTGIVYFTVKKGDGPSYYLHRMGEVTGKFPYVCCDEKGRIWLAGGNYTSPTPGITD